ncbi:hypothetical protein D3C78_1733840 [compost metagenome]
MAEDVGLQDRLGRAPGVLRRDALDELRDVDVGGAGLDAGRVIAVQAPVGFRQGLVGGQRGLEVRDRGLQALARQARHKKGVAHAGVLLFGHENGGGSRTANVNENEVT